MFKCNFCKLFLEDEHLVDGKCPECSNVVVEMCENDTPNCTHDIVSGVKVCEICGSFMCPECGNHDVEVLSRITGYYSPVNNGSWNSAKVEELKRRVWYDSL